MNNNRLGDLSEHKAVCWLWEQGYEVFKNCGSTGDVDIIATKDGELLKIDVKTVQVRPDGWMNFRTSNHEEQRAKGIRFLWVHENKVGWNRDYFQ